MLEETRDSCAEIHTHTSELGLGHILILILILISRYDIDIGYLTRGRERARPDESSVTDGKVSSPLPTTAWMLKCV